METKKGTEIIILTIFHKLVVNISNLNEQIRLVIYFYSIYGEDFRALTCIEPLKAFENYS